MKLSDHVKGKSTFSFYRGGYMYYVTDTGLEFPIPTSDAEGATFLKEDKSLFFMRWIRKHIENLDAGKS